MKIALISCSKEKMRHACPAYELYSASSLFSASYAFAKRQADEVYILSAKYGLVHENAVIEPYDQTLNNMSRIAQLDWANKVLEAIRDRFNVENDEFIILAGKNYYRDLIASLPHCYLPLCNLRMGERVAWINHQNAQTTALSSSGVPKASTAVASKTSMCASIHTLFNSLHRYTWDTISEVPFDNGIYIVFEKSEKYHGMDRIVRVGTHTSQGRLKKRLSDHFVRENHDGSIFRKNIGKAILNACHDPYLGNWTIDTSKPENAIYKDVKKNAEIEARVSEYIRENFSFVVFQVDEKGERLRLEEAIIATLYRTEDFIPSEKWAGKLSTEEEIRKSGMWLKQGLDAAPLTAGELNRIHRYCTQSSGCCNAAGRTEIPEHIEPQREKSDYGKYSPLYDFLSQRQDSRIELSFDDLDRILGAKLPPSALKYTMWWRGHAHCKSWLDAGYRVTDIQNCLFRGIVVFTR